MARKCNLRRKVENRIERILRKRQKQAYRQKKTESKQAAKVDKKLSCTTAVSTPWNGYLATKNTRFSILPGVLYY